MRVTRAWGLLVLIVLAAVKLAWAEDEPSFGLRAGETAPAVTLNGIDSAGDEITGDIRTPEKEDHQFTVLEFSQMGCGGCRLNLVFHVPGIVEKTKDKATFRLVMFRNPRVHASIKNFITDLTDFLAASPRDLVRGLVDQRVPVTYPAELPKIAVAYDVNARATSEFKVKFTPTTYVIDRAGKVVFQHVGRFEDSVAAEKEQKEKLIRAILGE